MGARRTRSGLGPFVARELVAAGAELAGFVVGREASLTPAREALAAAGVGPVSGHVSLEALLALEAPDAVAILSPAETHAGHLRTALAAGCHVLCEKPLVWGGEDVAARAAALVETAARAGLVLEVNAQWPETLPTFEALHGIRLPRRAKRFAMGLAPGSTGTAMLPDALPHALSLLEALTGAAPARVEAPAFEPADPGCERLHIRFDYVTPDARVASEVHLAGGGTVPRPAWYAVDGLRADREVHGPGYRLALRAGSRRVALPDPLAARVSGFLAAVQRARAGEPAAPARSLVHRMQCLVALHEAFAEAASLERRWRALPRDR